MHYIVQENLFNENGFAELIRVMEQHGLPYTVVTMIPFSGKLIPEIDPPQPCMVYGSVGLSKLARERGWTPGAWLNENFDYRVWSRYWAGHLANEPGIVCRFGEVIEHVPAGWNEFFLRPCLDDKSFTGEVLDRSEFDAWRDRLIGLDSPTLTLDTAVVIAEAQQIYQEYRFFVIGGKVITGSLYKLGGRAQQGLCLDQELIDFAQARVDQWAPAEGFVIDIGRTGEGIKIIEMGCLNGAGFYECSLSAILQAVEALEY